MAAFGERKAKERHAEAGRLFRRSAQSFGEDVSEAEVHKQTRQEEVSRETWPERLSGKFYMM